MKVSPEKALQHLDNAAKSYKGTRGEHLLLGVSVQVLQAVIRENDDLRAKLEAAVNAQQVDTD